MSERTRRKTRPGTFRSNTRDHVCHDYSSSHTTYPGKAVPPVWIDHTIHNICSSILTPQVGKYCFQREGNSALRTIVLHVIFVLDEHDATPTTLGWFRSIYHSTTSAGMIGSTIIGSRFCTTLARTYVHFPFNFTRQYSRGSISHM